MKFMLRSLLVVLLVSITGLAFGQAAGISGTLTDHKKKPLMTAKVEAKMGGISRGITVTDFDGNYTIKPLDPGVYTVTFTWQNIQQTLTDVRVTVNAMATANLSMTTTRDASKGKDIIVRASRVNVPPIVNAKEPNRFTKTSEDIEKMASTNLNDAASLGSQTYQSKNGGELQLGGARATNTQYVVDGMVVTGGATNLPVGSVDAINTFVSGTPARYGDAAGGIVAITTKGVSPKLRGGFRLDHSIDGYNTNVLGINLSGPLLKKKDSTGASRPVLGFTLNAEGRYNKDANPSYNKMYVLTDSKQSELEQNPLVRTQNANGTFSTSYATQNVTMSDMTTVKARPNAQSYRGTVGGKLVYALSDDVSITLGGEYFRSGGRQFEQSAVLFNSQSNLLNTSGTGRGYIRFTQKFSNAISDTSNKFGNITNAFYTVQANYQNVSDNIYDKNHKFNTFNYGYVGKFEQMYIPTYAGGYDSSTGAFAMLQRGYAPVGVSYQRANVNPILANYTDAYYNLTPQAFRINQITNTDISSGFLRNGDNPTSVYNLWENIGNSNQIYRKNNNQQIDFQIDASFDLKQKKVTHSIEFGLYYQQRNIRAYSLSAAALWQSMRLMESRVVDGSSLDRSNPTFVKDGKTYTKEDVLAGRFTPGPNDTVLYPRFANSANATHFDKALRKKLGAADNDYINIDALDPSFFSLDMFMPGDMTIGTTPLVNYYGYDHTGKQLNGQVNFNDYFKKNSDGYYERKIGAYRPNYMAGYISDYIQTKDFYLSLGLRVDRFDANTKVLKDPYSLVETVNAGTAASKSGITLPANIGSDYVAYVGDNTSASPSVIGYRNGDTWYDINGTEVQDPTTLYKSTNSKTLQPYLAKDANNRVVEIVDTSYDASKTFTDYKPQVNVMPRINFSFQLNEGALFYAHYDVMVQRPTTTNLYNPQNFASAADYYYLYYSQQNAIGNPDLKPEKMIDYEVGFRQKITDNSAFTLSGFYKERRNQIQIRQYYQAYPATYLTYGNRDFSTNKGFSLSYELRRIRNSNISATINYTLAFNEGTGSSATSNTTLLSSLIQAGYPNQRNLFPLSYDSRHMIVAQVDYHFKNNDGPTIAGKKVFQNAGANLIFRTRSGEPYTRYAQPNPLIGGGSNLIAGTVNGSRIPWHAMFDLNIDKDFMLKVGKKASSDALGAKDRKAYVFNVFMYVQNLLNTRDVLSIYGYTGRAGDDGYLTSAQGVNYTAQQKNQEAFVQMYNLRQQNIDQLNNPRRIVLGLKFNF